MCHNVFRNFLYNTVCRKWSCIVIEWSVSCCTGHFIIGLLSNTFKVQHVQYLKRGSIRKGISEGGTSSSTYLYLWTVDAGVRTVEEHMTFH